MSGYQADDQHDDEADNAEPAAASESSATQAEPATASAGVVPAIFKVAADATWRPIHLCPPGLRDGQLR